MCQESFIFLLLFLDRENNLYIIKFQSFIRNFISNIFVFLKVNPFFLSITRLPINI